MALKYDYFPGRAKVQNVLLSNDVDKIDITDLFREFSIEGNINSLSLIGQFTILDSTNLLAKYKVNSGDVLYIEIKYSDKIKTFPMRIVSIEQIAHTDRQRRYLLVCYSTFGYFANYTLISGVYEGTTSAIANKIFKNNSNEEIGIWEESVGKQRLVIPKWNLGYTLNWLAGRSLWSEEPVRFRCFQDTNFKLNFTPIEKSRTIYKQKPVIKYTHNLIATTVGPMQKPNSDAINRAIKKIIYNNSFDVRHSLKIGNISGTLYAPDIIEKTYDVTTFNYFENFNKEKSLNNYPQYRKGDFSLAKNVFDINVTDVQDSVDPINKPTGISTIRKSVLDDSQTINIEVVGNQSVDIGHVIEIEISSPEPLSTNRTDRIDTRWSGLYYVIAKRDIYKAADETHYMVLTCSKESQLTVDNTEVSK